MIDSNILEYSKLEPLNVSRETFPELEEFRSLILAKNKEINLISSNTESISRERHIVDSAQVFDFIEESRINPVKKLTVQTPGKWHFDRRLNVLTFVPGEGE